MNKQFSDFMRNTCRKYDFDVCISWLFAFDNFTQSFLFMYLNVCFNAPKSLRNCFYTPLKNFGVDFRV